MAELVDKGTQNPPGNLKGSTFSPTTRWILKILKFIRAFSNTKQQICKRQFFTFNK